MIGVHQYAYCRRLGQELAQQLQPFRSQFVGEKDYARDVAARSVNVGDESGLYRVAQVKITIGIVVVAALTANADVLLATITATCRRTKSLARAGNRSA
jgi:hypothetical protein